LLLQAQNLSIARGARTILAGLSFTTKSGEALLLTGPNGAGKTTLIRTLAGFIAPADGEIRLEGGEADRELGEQCHYVGHLTGVKSSLTAKENLAFWAEYLAEAADRVPIGERVSQALADLGLSSLANVPAGLLSAGQKRRLGLARLRIATRPVWLLDEPTVSLDAASTALLATLIQAHLAGDGIVIAATHLPLGLQSPTYLRLAGNGTEAAP
jgi:heme exporter protein A